jgi:DNA phosphorothioation-dependent restriction protein DptH
MSASQLTYLGPTDSEEEDASTTLAEDQIYDFITGGRPFNKLIVFDEAHKYMDNPDLTGHIVEVVRQMRHQGVSVLIASQDSPSLPNAIIELSSLVILHRFNSPQWLKHVQCSSTSLADLTPTQMAALRPGEAFVWANKATERIFTQKAVKMRFRPRVTQHGGETKRAV